MNSDQLLIKSPAKWKDATNLASRHDVGTVTRHPRSSLSAAAGVAMLQLRPRVKIRFYLCYGAHQHQACDMYMLCMVPSIIQAPDNVLTNYHLNDYN